MASSVCMPYTEKGHLEDSDIHISSNALLRWALYTNLQLLNEFNVQIQCIRHSMKEKLFISNKMEYFHCQLNETGNVFN